MAAYDDAIKEFKRQIASQNTDNARAHVALAQIAVSSIAMLDELVSIRKLLAERKQ